MRYNRKAVAQNVYNLFYDVYLRLNKNSSLIMSNGFTVIKQNTSLIDFFL